MTGVQTCALPICLTYNSMRIGGLPQDLPDGWDPDDQLVRLLEGGVNGVTTAAIITGTATSRDDSKAIAIPIDRSCKAT